MSENTQITVSAGRFPWVKAFEERYGVDRSQWRALTDAVFPNAKTLDSIVLALSYCKARNLDVFKRPVHIVPMYSTAANAYIDTIWPGIGELRTTAVRTGAFAGRDAAIYGPNIKGVYGEAAVEHPEWCEVIIYRMVQGQRVACHGPRVYWRETFATEKDKVTPNKMWLKRPHGQLEKCAEAAALRAAFPEEIGNEYTAEEMEGKVIEGRFEHVQESLAPAATRQPAQNKLAQFAAGEPAETTNSTAPEGSSSAPAASDEAVDRARVKAICEQLGVARSQKAINQIKRDAISFMAKLDEAWPDGKQQIVSAIAAAEESLGGAAGGQADGKESALARPSAEPAGAGAAK